MEQGEHEGNIYETHHQADLTPDVMKERYPKLSTVFKNQYYGYYSLLTIIYIVLMLFMQNCLIDK